MEQIMDTGVAHSFRAESCQEGTPLLCEDMHSLKAFFTLRLSCSLTESGTDRKLLKRTNEEVSPHKFLRGRGGDGMADRTNSPTGVPLRHSL